MIKLIQPSLIKSQTKIFSKVTIAGLLLFMLSSQIIHAENYDKKEMAIIQQNGRVKIMGKVVDVNGEPLVGVSIVDKSDAKDGSITNAEGVFTINVNKGAILKISYIGYATQMFKAVNGMRVVLQEDTKSLDEVIVVGYGKSSVRRLTSAISTLKGDNIVNMPNTNLISAMEGRMPGVFMQTAGGEPGALPTISIRGGGDPLYVIDGIPSSKSEFSVLSPNDIESFTVLKDAAAASVYGARAGNGIVMVTTKKGTSGKIKVSYDGYYAFSSPTEKIQFLSPENVAYAKDHASVYNGGKPTYMKLDDSGKLYWPDGVLEKIKNGTYSATTSNTDWNKLLFHSNAPSQSHGISINGGDKDTHYFMSGRYYHLGGIYKTNISKNDRINMRMHIDHNFNSIGLNIAGDVSFSEDKVKYPPHGLYSIWTHVARLNTLQAGFNSAGHPTGGPENPYVEIDPAAGYRTSETHYTNLAFSATWNVPKVAGLTLGALVHYNLYDSFGKSWYANESGVGPVWQWNDDVWELGQAHLSESMYRSNELTYEYRIDYNHTFSQKHTISATLLMNYWKYKSNNLGASRKEYETNVIEQINGGPSSTAENFGTAYENGRLGYVGRLKYDYMMRYLIEANFRYDGSDKFPKGKRWGFFPSISVGWNIDKEPFMASVIEKNYLTGLKVRGSWGKIGLDDVGNFQYLAVYYKGHDFYQDSNWTSTLYEGGLVSQDLTWYSRNTINFGLDAEFFNNRLAASFDYFYYRTTGYLASPSSTYITPLGTSLPKIKTNSAHRRAGYEINLNWNDHIGEFKYNVGFNFSYYNELWEKKYDEIEANLNNPLRRLTHQKSYYDVMYVSEGLYTSMDEINNSPRPLASNQLRPGDIKYRDINHDGVIDSNDMIRQGKPRFPHSTYGINLSASYKGFSIDALIQGTGPRNMMLESFNRIYNSDQIGLVGSDKFYYPDNTGEILYPRLTNDANTNGGNNGLNSTFWLLDASYIRLKNIKLSYDLKYKLLRSLPYISQFNIYVSGNNLFTSSKTKKYHIDPEDGRDDSSTGTVGYPVQKIIQIGMNLTF